MYTRCPSIVSIFQKAILLKDTKCNKIIHRQLCSESLVRCPNVGSKLKPTKRYFSGAPSAKTSMPKTRNIQGFGNTRNTLPKNAPFVPKFPMGLVEHQPMRPDQMQNNQAIAEVNNQSRNDNTQNSGKITIVIDKNEICSCTSPNESVVIHVTTKPETTQRKRLVDALSNADIDEVCRTKCSGCQQCEQVKRSRVQNVLPTIPAQPSVQQNFSNDFIGRQKNVFGIPLRSFSAFDGERSLKMETLNLKKSRSMTEFPGMRKMIVPNDFHQMQPNIGQLKMQHIPPVHRTRSESTLKPSGAYINNQPPNLQRSMGANIPQMQRHYGQTTQSSTPNQVTLQRHQFIDQQVKSHPVLNERNGKGIEELNQRKYSSFHQNEIPAKIPLNNPDVKESKQQKNEKEKSGRKVRKQSPPRPRITERVIRPATFSPNNYYSEAMQKLKPISAPTQKQMAANLFHGPFLRNPNFFKLQQTASKNKFPAGRASVPRMLTLQHQNPLNFVQRAHTNNVSATRRNATSISHGNSLIHQNMVNQKQFSVQRQPPLNKRLEIRPAFDQIHQFKNLQPPNNQLPRQMISYSQAKQLPQSGVRRNPNYEHKFPAPTNKLLPNQRRTLLMPVHHLPPQFILKKRSALRPVINPPVIPPPLHKRFELRPALTLNQRFKNLQPPTNKHLAHYMNSYTPTQIGVRRNPNFVNAQQIATKIKLPAGNGRPPLIAPIVLSQQTPNNKLQPNQRHTMLMPVHHLPPQFLLKKWSAPAINPQLNRPPSQEQSSFIPVAQTSGIMTHGQQSKLVPNFRNRTAPAPTSMTPVRKDFAVQRILPQNAFLQMNRSRASSSEKIPIVPSSSVYSTRSNGIAHPQLNRNNLIGSKKQRKPTASDKQQKRSDYRRRNGEQLQSSLPVHLAADQHNQIEKYVEPPKSLQIVGRPYSSQGNINRPRVNDTIQRFNDVPVNSFRLQQMTNVRQVTPPMNDRKSVPREQTTTRPDKQKDNLPAIPLQLPVVTPNTDNFKRNNPAVLFYAPGKLRLVNLPVPRLADEEGVIVKMLYVHLTDTDAHILSSIPAGPYKLSHPTIAGKSGSGVVVDAGKQVETVKVGDKVSVKGMSCGKYTACENDNEVMCERVPITEKLGILKRFHAVPAKFVTRLPDAVHPIDGAMIDELSSAIRACKKSTVTAGDSVLVLGGKSLGLWTALAAKSMGATNVCLADHRRLVLEQAKKLGIERVFLINPDAPVPCTSKSISEHMDRQCPRIVFDCNGSPLSNAIAINTSIIGGKVVLMKNSISSKPIVLSDAVARGIDILSSQHGNNDSERAAVQFLASGKVQLNGIDSSFFDITNVHAAFGLLNSATISNIFIRPSQPADENNANETTKNS